MTNNNFSNGPENNNTSSNNTTNNINKFLIEFCRNNIKNNPNKNNLLDLIFDQGEVPEGLINDVLDTDSNKDTKKYEGVKLEDVKLSDLKNKLASQYITLKSKRIYLEKNILNDYNLDTQNINTISDEIRKLSDIKLNSYINSDKKNSDFIKSVLGNNIRKQVNHDFSPFGTISESEYNQKLNGLANDNDKQQIETIFLEARYGKYTNENLKILIEKDFLNSTQKKEIVEKFIPTITLDEAVKIGFIANNEVKQKKKDILETYLNSISGLDNSKKDEIIEEVKNEDIKVKTKDFLTSDSNILKLSEEIGFKQYEKDLEDINADINEDLEKNGPNNFEDFKLLLTKQPNASGIENLKENSILNFSIEGNGKLIEQYYRLDGFNDSTKSISIVKIGNNDGVSDKITISKKSKITDTRKYFEIISFLQKPIKGANKVLNILSKEKFEEEINNEDKYEVEIDSLKQINTTKLNENPELKDKLKDNLQKKYSLNLEKLEKQLNEALLKKESLKLSDNNKNELDILNKKIENLNKEIEDKKQAVNEISDGNISDELLVAHHNFNDLLSKLDKIDSEGKEFGLSKGTILLGNSGDTEGLFFEIIGINNFINGNGDDESIVLKGPTGGMEIIPYELFFKSFKSNKAKRCKKVENFEEIMSNNSWGDDFELKNDKLIQKGVENDGKKEEKTVDYLVSKKGELIKIESIGDGYVEIKKGNVKEGKISKKEKEKGSKKDEIELEKTSMKISLNQLDNMIKEEKYKPDWSLGKSYTTKALDGYKNDIHGNQFTKYLNNLSLREMFMAGKMVTDGIEDYLKRGNEVKSAEFALKMSKFIPGEFSDDFLAQTEMKQDEAMEKELTALGKIGSGQASERVLNYIKNKDTPEYKKEAGLLFVAGYGLLYPKALNRYDKSFLWYEALGGKVGDKMYLDVKSKLANGKEPLPFDEKELIIELLSAQAGKTRRSKFHKKFKGAINGGYEEEVQKGEKDAKEKRNIADINEGGLGEIFGHTIPNALGWAKEAVNKGGTLKEMNEIYFCLIYSGAIYDAGNNVLSELKNQFVSGKGTILALFGSTFDGQKLFNKTVLELSKDIEKVEGGEYKGIANDAQEIFDGINDPGKKYNKKIEKTRDFWHKYGDVLSRALHMADNDDPSYAKTDKLIAFGKDSKYKDYYNSVKGGTDLPESIDPEGHKYDLGENGSTGVNTNHIIRKFIVMDTNGAIADRNKDAANKVWPTIWKDIKSTKEKIDNSPENENEYRKYLNNKLREITAGMLYGAGPTRLPNLAKLDPVGLDLASKGINLTQFNGVRNENILDGSAKKDIFNNAVDKIISGGSVESSGLEGESILDITDTSKEEVNDIIDFDSELMDEE